MKIRKVSNKLKSTQGVGMIEILFLIILIVVCVLWIIRWSNLDRQASEHLKDNQQYMSPTAGIIYYMARLQYHTLKMAEPEIVEPDIKPVAMPSPVNEEALNPEDYLVRLFGYVPADWELEYLYRTVKVESGYLEPDEGVMAVIYVIANRCRSDQFPDTIYEVISQRNQFETWSNGAIQNCNYVEDYFVEVIDDVIAEDPCPEYRDLLFFTSGYYNPYCKPAFVIGHHYFGK